MRSPCGIRRVIVAVLDGLRPDAIDAFDLRHIRRLADGGAATMAGTTVAPSVTAAAITSLLTGVPPRTHGFRGARLYVPRPRETLRPVPSVLSEAGFPTSTFMRELPPLHRSIGRRIARVLGVGHATFAGQGALEILQSATETIETQSRGLVVLHWPDADQAGEEFGWMSPEYAAAARQLDTALGLLATLGRIPVDPSTVLIALADHGGGGVRANDHDSSHPLDRTIPILLAGRAVVAGSLAPRTTLLDVPATVLWAFGVSRPPSYVGRPLVEAFTTSALPTESAGAA